MIIQSVPSLLSEAEALYAVGLNVFAIQPGSKLPYGPHAFLTTTRLYGPSLPSLVAGSNIAVMTGRLSQNLFILDCDSPEAFERIGTALEGRNIRAWIRNGARGGQFWLLCREGEVANTKIDKVDVLGNRKYAVAPPSIHPSDMVYEWTAREGNLPPVVSLAQLDFLPLQLASLGQRRANREKQHVLPPVANAVLVEQNIAGYASHSEAEYAVCLSLIGAGFNDGMILRLFDQFAPPHYTKVGAANFQKYVLNAAHTYRNGSEQSVPRSDHSSRFVEWAETRPWPGRTGSTDKAVFLALCQRMQREAATSFRASIREIAESAGVNKETALSAIHRLTDAGLVHPDGHDQTTGAGLYTLSVPESLSREGRCVIRTLYPTGGVGDPGVRILHHAHDAWHPHALGKAALACYTALLLQPMSAKGIAEATGRTRFTVQRALRALEQHGLIHYKGDTWEAVETTREALDKIALDYGTLGKACQRVEQHQTERQQHASLRLERQKLRWHQQGGTLR
jgi:predicted transcriptional regulator